MTVWIAYRYDGTSSGASPFFVGVYADTDAIRRQFQSKHTQFSMASKGHFLWRTEGDWDGYSAIEHEVKS